MRKTIIQVLMEQSPTGKPKAPAPPQDVAPAREPRPSVDAMSLTPEDYRRRLAQLGLSLPADAETSYRPMGSNVVEHQRAVERSRRSVDRAGRRVDQRREGAEHLRSAEIKPGSFDARSATPEQVRARYEQLGLDASPTNVYVREGGRPLDSRTQADESHAASAQHARDREVAHQVHQAINRGERFDVRRLNAGEFAALMALRGGGGYEPVR